ncbi:hypothetical protein IFR04_005137 [Cadophora malorum]|uniref:Uncharacterized protein n=1 Tax=Cadophora malorum TaxID=108018 RepID=A0A8H7TMM9_9HELO|nr:hypothetical protein IFR04_005137 [Cadophora malorum]
MVAISKITFVLAVILPSVMGADNAKHKQIVTSAILVPGVSLAVIKTNPQRPASDAVSLVTRGSVRHR